MHGTPHHSPPTFLYLADCTLPQDGFLFLISTATHPSPAPLPPPLLLCPRRISSFSLTTGTAPSLFIYPSLAPVWGWLVTRRVPTFIPSIV
jgi:hypothetical protein